MATIANLSIAVTINAGNATQQLKALTVQVNNFSQGFQQSMTGAITVGNLFSQVISKIFNQAQQNFKTFVTNSIKYSQEFNNALVGLSSVATAFGVTATGATDAARKLSQDGLLPLRDSAAGLKNLLMTGFGLEDSIKIMNVFKDSAVYARQGFLSYGDAIRTATEGLKNSQSRLVDNVGITKNLSVIMKEYGYQLQDISDKHKGAAARQVLMNGLMREAAAMAGDAARSLQTYTGAVTAVDTAWISLQAEIGTAITTNKSVQVVLTMLAEALRDCTTWLTSTGKGAYFVSDALVFMLRWLKATLIVLDLTQQGLSYVTIKALEFAKYLSESMTEGIERLKTLVWILAQLPGGAAALGLMGVSVKDLQEKFDQWREKTSDVSEALTTVKESSQTLTEVFGKGKGKLDDMIEAAIKYRGQLVDMGGASRTTALATDDLTSSIDRSKKKLDKTVDTYRELLAVIKKRGDTSGFAEAIEDIIRQLPKFKAGMEGVRDATFGFKEIKAAYEMVAALGGVENITKLTEDQQQALNKAVGEALDQYRALGITADKTLTDIWLKTTKLIGFEQNLPIHALEDMFDPNQVKAWTAAGKRELENFAGWELTLPRGDFATMLLGDPEQSKQWVGLLKGNIEAEIRKSEQAISGAFYDVFAEIPNILREVLAGGGGLVDIMVGLGAMAGQKFNDAFQDHLEAARKGGRGLTGGEKALGLAGAGLEAFVGGYGIGASQGKAKGALGGAGTGALSGAMMGSMFGPGGTAIGAIVGGAAGLFGGLFGGSKKAKEDKKKVAEMRAALLEQYGGMAKLRTLAEQLGVDLSAAFNAKNPEQFTAAVEKLNDAIEEQKKRIEGLNTALAGVNDRAALFADKFSKVYDTSQDKDASAGARDKATKRLAAMAQASEAEFAGLGLMIRDTFAGLVKETGSGLAALQQMAPAFQVLEDGVSKWGLTSTAVIDELRANFALVNDTAFKPLFAQITATGEVLKGLFDASALSPEGFQAIAADIGASIQTIVNKGGDMSKTLALSQPVLQDLWEAQQKYGKVTDETTQAILNQAEEQGLVGAHMKDVNEKILDVLLAIGKVLGADLPQYFDGLKQPAADAAASIEGSFNNISIDPLTIKVRYDAEKPPEGIPHLAKGGIVRRPTLALIGEGGPEAVVPLTGAGLGASATYETTIVLDGEKIARSSAKRMPKFMREMGIGHWGLTTMALYPDVILADGPSHYWRLNEATGTVAADQVGGKPCTILGTVTLNQPGPFETAGAACAFAGGALDATVLAFPSAAFSFEGWFNTAAGGFVAVMATAIGAPGRALFLNEGKPRLWAYTAASVGIFDFSAPLAYNDGQWHHIVGTWDGTTTVPAAIYVDGALVASQLAAEAATPANHAFHIAELSDGGFKYSGLIDEVAVYPGALSAAQVAAHYAARLALPPVSKIAPTIIIATVDRTNQTRAYSVRYEYSLGARARADFEVRDFDSGATAFRPTVDQRVELRRGAAVLFAGRILSVTDKPLGDPNVGTVTAITAVDDWVVAGVRRVSEFYDAGKTLKFVVDDLVGKYLAIFGLTVGAWPPSAPTGPALLPALTFDGITIEEAFNQLVDLTGGWIYRLEPTGQILWFGQAHHVQGDVIFSAANRNILGPLEWTKARTNFANRVIVRYGTGLVGGGNTFTGDGVTTRFNLSFPVAQIAYLTYQGGPYPPGKSGIELVAMNDPATTRPWWVDVAAQQLVRKIGAGIPGGVAAAPAPGDIIKFYYNIQFPQAVSAETPEAVTGPVEAIVERGDIFNTAQALAVAQTQLERVSSMPRTLRLATRLPGAEQVRPGDSWRIDVPERLLPLAESPLGWMVVETRVLIDIDQEPTTTFTLLEATAGVRVLSWINFWRDLAGTGAGVGIATGTTMPPPHGTTQPPPGETGGGTGDVGGPAGSSDTAVARWDGLTGKLLQNSAVTLSDGGVLAGAHFPNTAGLKILDTNATHALQINVGEDLTADRALTLTVGNANRTLAVTGPSSIGGTAYVVGGPDVAVADGGTGISTYAVGDLLIATAPNTLTRLTVGFPGQVIQSVDGLPRWATGGDVAGPASSEFYQIAMFNGTTGKILAASAAKATPLGSLWSVADGGFYMENRAGIVSPIDGCLALINWSGTGFDLLQFGGHTADFPALKRNAAGLECRLADDAALTTFKASAIEAESIDAGTIDTDSLVVNGVPITGPPSGGATGDVVGPASATPNALAIYDGATGKLIKNSLPTVNFQGTVILPGASVQTDTRGGFALIEDGVARLNNFAGTGFNRLQFGGHTATFPALKVTGTGLSVRAADDSEMAFLQASDYYEKGRAVPMGHWIDVPYLASNYYGLASMVWTVDPADVGKHRYTLIGKTLILQWALFNTACTGTLSNGVHIKMPPGFVVNGNCLAASAWIWDSLSKGSGYAAAVDNGNAVLISKVTEVNFGATLHCHGQIILPLV